MARGYASDVDGCETVMKVPHGTLTIDLKSLPKMQGERLAVFLHNSDVGGMSDDVVDEIRLALEKGEEYGGDLPTANIHIDVQNLIMILNEAGIADIPTGAKSEDTSTPEPKEEL
jgi:hypothetical protein